MIDVKTFITLVLLLMEGNEKKQVVPKSAFCLGDVFPFPSDVPVELGSEARDAVWLCEWWHGEGRCWGEWLSSPLSMFCSAPRPSPRVLMPTGAPHLPGLRSPQSLAWPPWCEHSHSPPAGGFSQPRLRWVVPPWHIHWEQVFLLLSPPPQVHLLLGHPDQSFLKHHLYHGILLHKT